MIFIIYISQNNISYSKIYILYINISPSQFSLLTVSSYRMHQRCEGKSTIHTPSSDHNISSKIKCLCNWNCPEIEMLKTCLRVHLCTCQGLWPFSDILMITNYGWLGLQWYIFPRYDMYPDTVVTIRYTIWNVGHRKSTQLTSLHLVVGSTHAFVVSTILNVTLNTAQHGFFSSVCSENHSAFIRTKKRKEGEH